MTATVSHPTPPRTGRGGFSASVAVSVGVAAAAMVATLPGRTYGLGLITEPLMADLGLAKVPYAALNFWATLIGAAFCIPVGWAIDRFGVRGVLAAVLVALGAVVLTMAGIAAGSRTIEVLVADVFFEGTLEWAPVPRDLFVLVLLTRGFGQSALSVVSLALVGKVAGKKPGVVIGAYSFLVALGYGGAVSAVKVAFERFHADWRTVWAGMGLVLLVFGALALVFVRNPKVEVSTSDKAETPVDAERSYTLSEALLTPGFWVFGLATSFYGLVTAGVSLFNQSLLAERGFDRSVFLTIGTVTPMIGLAANLGAGWLATKIRLGYLLAVSLMLLAAALAVFPYVTTLVGVYTYAATMGVAGGVLTVVFFTVWRQAFGPVHLGQIQGAAQLLTVFASAGGPLVLAAGHRAAGSYVPVMQSLAAVAAVFVVLALAVPLPDSTALPPEDEI